MYCISQDSNTVYAQQNDKIDWYHIIWQIKLWWLYNDASIYIYHHSMSSGGYNATSRSHSSWAIVGIMAMENMAKKMVDDVFPPFRYY